jgi:MFS family permease
MKHLTLARSHTVYTIAIIGFICALHIVIPMYSNSSFLSLFADGQTLGLIYMMGSAFSILGFIIAPFFIRTFGNYKTALVLVCIQIGLFYGLVTSSSPLVIATVFALQMGVISLISLTLDIFLEVYTDGPHVGTIRGIYTTALNASWLVGPLIGSVLINGTENYRSTYVVALAMLFPLLYLIYRNFDHFHDPKYTHFSPWQLFKHISSNKDWTKLFFANTVLQVFYAWMVVYSPIYLNKTLGFDWTEIGIILTIMLLPFILIQYPLGKLADSRYGEKEIMSIGFAIMGFATIMLAFVGIPNIWVWAIMLFITRIGAAAAEIMLETYFFKTVSARDAGVLGSFRITRPISFFIAPLITGFGLLFTSQTYIFVIVGVISLIGLLPALTIRDTK